MSAAWASVIAVGAGTAALKAVGPVAAAGAVAVVLRAPIWVVVVAGAAATALVRLVS